MHLRGRRGNWKEEKGGGQNLLRDGTNLCVLH
jgi:hypothetical protein